MDLGYINIHTHFASNNNISIMNIRTIDNIPDNLYSIGVHPWYALEEGDNLDMLLIDNPNYMAVGEIGLDKSCSVSYNTQIEVFKAQLKIAKRLKKVVIIHNVKSTSEILNILKNKSIEFIFHGFIGNILTANQIIKNGGYVSFGRAIFNHKKTIDTLSEIDTSRIFLETDNLDIKIEDVYSRASEITGLNLNDLKGIIHKNYKAVFKC